MNSLLNSALNGAEHEQVPVWFMRQAGRYMPSYRKMRKNFSMEEICHSPQMAAEITHDAAHYLGVDAAIIFSDIMIPLENLGYRIKYVENVGPIPERTGNIREMYKSEASSAIRYFRSRYQDLPVIGFIGGPLTIASYIIAGGPDRELRKTKELILTDEDNFRTLMNEVVKISLNEAREQILAGAAAIQIFDSWLGFLDPVISEYIILDFVKKIVDGIKKLRGKSIYFTTGTSGFVEALTLCGADVLSLDWRCSLGDVHSAYPNMGLQGNLDPVILAKSLSKSVERSVMIMKEMQDFNRYIFNLGHGILPETDPGNVRSLVKKLKEIKL